MPDKTTMMLAVIAYLVIGATCSIYMHNRWAAYHQQTERCCLITWVLLWLWPIPLTLYAVKHAWRALNKPRSADWS